MSYITSTPPDDELILEIEPYRYTRLHTPSSKLDSRTTESSTCIDGDQEYNFEKCSLISSITTNATADDLPGPGRILGNFYSYAGCHLEVQIGRLAEKMGKGPRMAADRIIRRRTKARSLSASSKKIENKNGKVIKDCQKLLKYVMYEAWIYSSILKYNI